MKLRLIDVMFRPVRTARRLVKLVKDIELQPVFAPQERMSTVKTMPGSYIVLSSTVLMPTAVYNMISSSLVKVDYDWQSKSYSRKKDQDLSVACVKFEEAVAMMVQERLNN